MDLLDRTDAHRTAVSLALIRRSPRDVEPAADDVNAHVSRPAFVARVQ
jgi:hypothetical protein